MSRLLRRMAAAAFGALLAGAALAGDAGVRWDESYTNGMAVARREGRPALLFFSSDSCGWCRLMEKEVFADASVAADLTNRICIRVKTDRDPLTAELYGVQSMPRTVLISADRRLAGELLGYVPADRFRAWLKDAAAGVPADAQPVPEPPAPDLAAVEEAARGLRSGDGFPETFLACLADRDPRVREEAARRVRALGRGALIPLVRALSADYLGARIAAWELLREQVGAEPAYDPWAAATARNAAAAAWAARLPALTNAPAKGL